jgi:hypothetical protein
MLEEIFKTSTSVESATTLQKRDTPSRTSVSPNSRRHKYVAFSKQTLKPAFKFFTLYRFTFKGY